MKKIAELLSRDLSRRIEEVIQVDQAEEQAVFAEIDEYIATDSIRDQYAHLLKAIAEAPSDPNEAIGVWVSGFFGSGKSSFAKNLGYALQNNTSMGSRFRRFSSGRSTTSEPVTFSISLIPGSPPRLSSSTSPRSRTRGEYAADFRVPLRRPASALGLRRGLRHRRA